MAIRVVSLTHLKTLKWCVIDSVEYSQFNKVISSWDGRIEECRISSKENLVQLLHSNTTASSGSQKGTLFASIILNCEMLHKTHIRSKTSIKRLEMKTWLECFMTTSSKNWYMWQRFSHKAGVPKLWVTTTFYQTPKQPRLSGSGYARLCIVIQILVPPPQVSQPWSQFPAQITPQWLVASTSGVLASSDVIGPTLEFTEGLNLLLPNPLYLQPCCSAIWKVRGDFVWHF